MTIDIPRSVVIGVTAVLVIVIAAFVVIHRQGHVATVNVAPLSAADRHSLTDSRPLIESIPTALKEVPVAASDASGGRVSVSEARALLARTAALSALSDAVTTPAAVSTPLTDAYDAVLAGRTPPAADALAQAVQQLQTVEGQIEPAIRLVAAHDGPVPSAAATLTTIETDRRVNALAQLLAGWQQIYGALVLVEQSAAT